MQPETRKGKSMRNWTKLLAGVAALGSLCAMGTANADVIADTAPDGAVYSLTSSNVGNLYTFTFTADFTGAVGSQAFGDYAMALSFQSQPGSVDWTAGTVGTAEYGSTNWFISQNVSANSNGCPGSGSPGSNWCVGLKTSTDLTGQSTIDNTSVLSWTWTMTLTSGTPVFDNWSYKFVTTTGDQSSGQWVFGNYQISRTLSVPEPTTLSLLGVGLLGLGFGTRRRRKA